MASIVQEKKLPGLGDDTEKTAGMKLLKLSLRNFKGIGSFEFEPNGKSATIYGDNATGKTTLVDGWLWLLFGKDSQNKTDFEIKMLGPDGQPQHGLEHEVEGVLDVNGKEITLKKVYSENWTKKRGSASKEFTGHSTDYYLDGVPVKKNEFEAKIASILDEDAFKLLTNPRHFNEVLHWQDRRKVLMEVCGDVRDDDVIASDETLATLPGILNGRTLEDHRKVLAAKRTEINKELSLVPVRIDETQRGLSEEVGKVAEVQASLTELNQIRKQKSQELANIEAGGGIAEKTKALREVEAEQVKIQKEHWVKSADETKTAKVKLRKLEDQAGGLDSAITNLQRLISNNQEAITLNEKKLVGLRETWNSHNKEQLVFEQTETCPTCGQSIPKEQLEEAREKALASFNLSKSEYLDAIVVEGKAVKERNDRLITENAETEGEIKDLQQKKLDILVQIDQAKVVVSAMEQKESDYETTAEYFDLQKRKGTIEQQIVELREANSGEADRIRAEIAEIDTSIANGEQQLAQVKQRESGLKRIEELKAQEKTLAAEFEKLEQELYLTEQFVRTKVHLLESKINSKFTLARFKLFDEQVNGAIAECCETTYHGAPYATALSNSERINVGLDIINTLAEHFNFMAPIWVDNCEAVTRLIPTKGQQIKLYVSEADKVLRKEEN